MRGRRRRGGAAPNAEGGRVRSAARWAAKSHWPLPLSVALSCALALSACSRPAAPAQGQPIWSVQLAWQNWPTSTYADLQRQGANHAELNLQWNQIEPRRSQFNFTVLDANLAAAAAAHIRLIPIFWQSVWTGNPPAWVSSHDLTSTGATAAIPAWWNRADRQAYFDYVTTTIAHIRSSPGFGGAFLDYGWLDAMWGQPPQGGAGINGYAAEDIARFHRWLPSEYGSLRRFNAPFGTHYASWAAVPAARPGQPLFSVYQAFRAWSVQETYGALTAAVRRVTAAPLYYYWGGDLANAGQFFNLPDTFFALARRYHVTVVLDDADHTGLAILFGSLARAYGVPLLQEWTPRPSGLTAEVAQWLGHVGFGAPREVGLDFFLFQGGQEYQTGYPVFSKWIGALNRMRGAYPQQPVAVYVSFGAAFERAAALAGISDRLAAVWQQAPTGLQVVTDREVASGVVRLAAFRAVLPLTGTDAAVQAYAAHGGHLVQDAAGLLAAAPAYVTLAPAAGLVETVPTVDAAARRAWITVAEVNAQWAYDGAATVHYAGLGLPDGQYHLVEAETGQAVPAVAVAGGLEVPLHLASGEFHVWELLPGAGTGWAVAGTGAGTGTGAGGPGAGAGGAGTGAGAGVAGAASARPGPATVAATAGEPPDGLAFLGVGATGKGSDGNLDLVTQGGVRALASQTVARLATPAAFLYLQIDPSSAVYAARRIQVAVTYLAVAGQGFQVQYDGAKGAYENGQSVSSPGTGKWTTATVTLPDARFAEAQNGGADLRLAVRDGKQPLVVREVRLTAAG